MSDKNQVQLKVSPSFVFFLTATLLVVILYGNTLKVPFIFDDLPNIVENNALHWNKPLSIVKITNSLISHRPFSNFTFGLNYYFGKLNVKGYHLVNITLHFLNTLLLFYFLKLIFNLSQENEKHAPSLALMISLIWAASPVQTQAVNYIVQRMTLLACFFYLLGLIAYIKARTEVSVLKIYWIILTFIFGGMALLSKENTVVFPITCLLVDYFFISKFQWIEFKNYIRKIAPYFLFAGILIVIYLLHHPEIQDIFLHRSTSQEFTIWERVMTEWRVLVYYLSLLIYPNPNRLSIDYLYPISKSFFEPITTFTSIILIVVLIGSAIKKAKDFPLISFGIFWFFINLFVESTFIPIDLAFEHRLYLPSIGFFISVCDGFCLFFSNKLANKNKLMNYGSVIFLLILTVQGFFTIDHNREWKSVKILWEKTIEKYPESFRAHLNLSKTYETENNLEAAKVEILKAISLRPDTPTVHNNYGSILLKMERPEEAVREFRQAIVMDPNMIAPRLNLANFYLKKGKLEEAEKEVLILLSFHPLEEKGYLSLGNIYERQNSLSRAKESYLRAISIDPENEEGFLRMGLLSWKNNDLTRAEIYLKKAMEQNWQSDEIHKTLGVIYQSEKKYAESLQEYILAYQINPDNPTIHYNIGSLFQETGNSKQAIEEYEKGVNEHPQSESIPLLTQFLLNEPDPNLKAKISDLLNRILDHENRVKK